ncbi:hypothetical protein [Paenibacillus sp. 1001270B_150601_E10]|uniref:hypothetical protein n=1 Tax=Paenibacillus sp. 1001270B_150601_E10 TaxID=2787079 RepID=UPI00189CAEE1|nr:hypothetical protein [Paenibacillus sp. 1001270B_150601_E10]
MSIVQAFRTLKRHPYVILQPIVIDMILLGLLLVSHAFPLESQSSSRVILSMGLPSIFQLFSLPFSWFLLVVILLWSFGQGGYIRALVAACEDTSLPTAQIMKANTRYGLPFMFLYFALLLATSAAGALLLLLFGTIGSGAALLFFLAFRVLFVYLEFTMVTDRLPFDAAFRRAFQTLKQHWPASIGMAALILIFSGAASLIANLYTAPILLLVILVVYNVMMTLLFIALMHTYNEARRYEG